MKFIKGSHTIEECVEEGLKYLTIREFYKIK